MNSAGGILLVAAIVAGVGTAGGVWAMPRMVRTAASVLTATLIAATTRLVWAIAKLDFSFSYVANQSRARSSSGYRLAALWGGAEGSLLFFTTLAAIVFLGVVWRTNVAKWGIAVPATVITTMTFTIAAFANPFARADLPAVRGAGLTPILEHPAMLYHPPILYLGLVSTLVPFAIVLDRSDIVDATKRSLIRRWLLIAWTLLTVGLATGANWAYVELGWGGYWAWDPVENTVLMPWLVLTAGIHFLRSEKLVARFPRALVGILLAPFVLVVFGTAVTRSGGLSSVHAFADAEALGWMLGMLVVLLVVVLIARVVVESTAPVSELIGGRALFVAAAIVVALFMSIVVMMGVGVPLLPGVNRVVTAPFYNRVGTPVLVIALLAMLAMPLPDRRVQSRRANILFVTGVVAAAVATGFVASAALGLDDVLSLATVSLAAVVIFGHGSGLRDRPATLIGHIGFVVVAIGIAASAQSVTVTTVMAPGEAQQFGSDLTLTYESFVVADGPRFRSEAVTFRTLVTSNDDNLAVILTPGLVSYPDRAVVLAETALHSRPGRDIQVVVRTVADDGLASFELSERPGQMLVWWGSVLMVLAGVVAVLKPNRG